MTDPVGLPTSLSAFGVGDTLDEALDDLADGIRALFRRWIGTGRAHQGNRCHRRRCGLMPVRLSGKEHRQAC